MRSYASTYLARVFSTTSAAARGRAASGPSRSRRASRARTACRRRAGRGPARTGRRGQKREESGVSTSSASTMLAVGVAAELELGVGQDDALALGVLGRRARRRASEGGAAPPSWRGRRRSRPRGRSRRSRRARPARPWSAGVKIGSGRRSDSRSPAGRSMPQTGLAAACTPSSPSRTGSPAPRTRPGRCRASRTSSAAAARLAPARRWRPGGWARCPRCGRTRTRTGRSAPCPCPGSAVGSTTS